MGVQNSVQRQFGPVAASYATSSVHASGPDLFAMVEAANLLGDERVLDVAVGGGHTTLAFARGAAEVIGVDLTEAMLTAAQGLAEAQGVTNVSFQAADAEHLPFPDASFDIVTCRYAAHHFPHPAVAAREWARVLKSGGKLLLVDVVSPDDPTSDTFLNAAEVLRDPSHVRDHSVAQWLDMLQATGLKVEELGQFPLRLEFASWTERMRTPQAAREQILALFAGAPTIVHETLHLEPDGTFTCPVVLIRGEKG
jgi:ubiquinone/menaquinone biosynthesis C-methylase UbiE